MKQKEQKLVKYKHNTEYITTKMANLNKNEENPYFLEDLTIKDVLEDVFFGIIIISIVLFAVL